VVINDTTFDKGKLTALRKVAKSGTFSRFFGGVTSLQGAHWVPEDNAEKRFFSAKKNKRAMILQGLIYARTEASAFIFGKVDLRRLAMHCQARPPHNLKKSPPLNVKSYSC
jgi:hypothetical protein